MSKAKYRRNDEARMSNSHPHRDLIALGIRQPWAELILRGVKTLEVRTLETRVRGPIYLYASKRIATIPAARRVIKQHDLSEADLPTGVIVGTIEIVGTHLCDARDTDVSCVPQSFLRGKIGWELARPERLPEQLKPRFLPYGVWFYPFRRRNGAAR
jgi:hypothetical protein